MNAMSDNADEAVEIPEAVTDILRANWFPYLVTREETALGPTMPLMRVIDQRTGEVREELRSQTAQADAIALAMRLNEEHAGAEA